MVLHQIGREKEKNHFNTHTNPKSRHKYGVRPLFSYNNHPYHRLCSYSRERNVPYSSQFKINLNLDQGTLYRAFLKKKDLEHTGKTHQATKKKKKLEIVYNYIPDINQNK